jgi:hypothetical protein
VSTHVVVELGLGDRVVDVDGGDLELAVLEHLVEVVDTGGGLLRDTVDAGEVLGELVVDKVGKVTSVVEDHVERLALGEGGKGLLNAPKVLLLGLALPGVDGDTGSGNGGGGLVLGGEDVARRPGDLGTESGEGLDAGLLVFVLSTWRLHVDLQDGGLDGHVEASGDTGTSEGLGGAVLGAEVHESGTS